MPYRDMPEPLSLGKVLGPSVILAGLGVGSGEYIIWPFMTATVGTGFLWAAILSVTVQYFLNMEIERYTLATGETAVSGFVRFWKPWGVLFCLFTILPNMWPGWATSGVTILTFLMGGGDVPLITIGILVASGIALTTSPVVYQTLERAQFFKVGLTLVFLAVAIVAAISPSAWADLPQAITNFGRLPDSNVIPISLILSGLVFAGAGGVNNLAQSNWIRDKGFGMGVYIPRIVSPITGEEAAAPATGSMVRQDAENIRRFHGWWAVANKEQLVSFWFICVFSITVFSTLAYSTVFGQNISSGQANLAFIKAEGEALKTIVAPWFGTFFWVFGALSMILVALGTIDYISRIVADVLKTVYLQQSQRWTESRIYFLVAWGTIAAGSTILMSGFNQPLLLLVIAACLNGMVMFVYSILLIQLNRRGLPPALRVRWLPAGDAALLDRVLRLLRGLAGDRAGAGVPGGTLKLGGDRRDAEAGGQAVNRESEFTIHGLTPSLLRHAEAGHDRFGVVGEADPVNTIGRLQLAGGHEIGLGVARDDGAVDRALDAVALDRHGDLLGDGLVLAGGLVHRCPCFSTPAVHLEGRGPESAHDEVAVAVGGAVQVALFGGPHVVAGDEDAVRVRVIVDVHVLRLVERRLHRVVARRLVRGVPVGQRQVRS